MYMGTIGTKECCCGERKGKGYVLKSHCFSHREEGDYCPGASVHFNAERGFGLIAMYDADDACKLIRDIYKVACSKRKDKTLKI